MDNITSGVLTVVLASVIFFASFYLLKKEKAMYALLLVVFGGLILRGYSAKDQYLHDWDEKYHAVVAKHMMDHPLKPTLYEDPVLPYDPKEWTGNHLWIEKGPIPLLAIASSLKIFGLSEFSVRIPSIIIGSIAIVLTFFIGTWLFNRKIGMLAAFLHAINGLIIELVGGRISSDHVENFFIFFIELAIFFAVYFLVKKQHIWVAVGIGLATGLAVLSKWFPALLVFPVWLIPLFLSKNISFKQQILYGFIALFFCTIVVTPYFFYLNNNFPEEFNFVAKKFLFAYSDTVESHSAPWYYYINQIGIIFGECVIVAIVIFSLWSKRLEQKWKMVLIHLWWLIPILIFSTAQTKRATYILLAAPAFMIMIAAAYYYLKDLKLGKVLSVVRYLLMIAFIALPVRYSIERLKPFVHRDLNPREAQLARSFANLPYDPKTVILFNVDFAIEAMFYSDYTVYKNHPKPEEINLLNSKERTILIYNEDENNFSKLK